MSGKQEPAGPPPPTYSQHDTASTIGSPAPAHLQAQNTANAQPSDYYGASPNMPHPTQPYNAGYPPQGYPPQGAYGPQGGAGYPQSNGYYAPGPQMGYQQQPYGPQGMYYGQPQGGYYRQDQRSSGGFLDACLAGLACCCCLELLF